MNNFLPFFWEYASTFGIFNKFFLFVNQFKSPVPSAFLLYFLIDLFVAVLSVSVAEFLALARSFLTVFSA